MPRIFLFALFFVASNCLMAAETGVEISRVSKSSYGTSFLVKSPEGVQVAMDPFWVIKDLKADVITVSHPDPDHVDRQFHQDMKAQGARVFENTKADFQKGDVKISSVPAMHNPVPLKPEEPSNTIFVVETAGLRIAHFGDLGQTDFTPEQLAALGRIDVAFMQFENSNSELLASEGRAFRLMNRIKPRLIVPTHVAGKAWDLLSKTYGPVFKAGPLLRVSANTLPAKTRVVELDFPK